MSDPADDDDDVRAQVQALAARVRELEDHIALTQLVSRYGPAVDSGASQAAAELWEEDGVFDVPPFFTLEGRDAIAGMVESEGHQALIHNGGAHVLTVPHVVVDGDEAQGWSYALNIRWDPDADRFWVARVSANGWRFHRGPDGWRIARRVNTPLDGRDEPRSILAGSVEATARPGR